MAGDWIKVDATLPDKPEVFAIAEYLGIDPDAACGKLVRIFVWANQQSRDGHAGSVTKMGLDCVARVTGMSNALIAVGWLKETPQGLIFTNFERHNGESAKKRALANRRKAESRRKHAEGVT